MGGGGAVFHKSGFTPHFGAWGLPATRYYWGQTHVGGFGGAA